MSRLVRNSRWLLAAVIVGATASAALAQLKPWPDQQPQQAPAQAWPGDNRPATSGAAQPAAVQPPPMNSAPPPGMGMGAPGMGMGGPPQQQENPCMAQFTKMRGDVERAGRVAKVVHDRKGTREEFCKAITGLHAAQARWVTYANANASKCGIPGEVLGQLRTAAASLNKMRAGVCSGGATAAGGGGPPPAPSLSEALGTSSLPITGESNTRRGAGTLDTLTGATIR